MHDRNVLARNHVPARAPVAEYVAAMAGGGRDADALARITLGGGTSTAAPWSDPTAHTGSNARAGAGRRAPLPEGAELRPRRFAIDRAGNSNRRAPRGGGRDAPVSHVHATATLAPAPRRDPLRGFGAVRRRETRRGGFMERARANASPDGRDAERLRRLDLWPVGSGGIRDRWIRWIRGWGLDPLIGVGWIRGWIRGGHEGLALRAAAPAEASSDVIFSSTG